MIKNNSVLRNASWLIGCRIIQSALSFVVSMLTARYLGPSNFGTINYAISLVAFIAPIMSLGYGSILVQEIIEKPDKEGEALGTSLGGCLLSGFFCIIGIIAFTMITSVGETETIIVCALYSLTLIAQALEVIQYWFQAKLLAKYTAVVGIIAYIVVSAYKIFLLATGKSVYWFAVSNAIDYTVVAVSLIAIYHKVGTQKLSFSWKRAKQMLSVSKYYIISGMMIAIFGQTDRIMLKHLVSEASTGFYAAAASCSGITGFVFVALIDSARPSIFEARRESIEGFELNMKRLYAAIICLALAQSAVVCLGADWIVGIIYGADYRPTVQILQVLVWYTTFSYIGSVRNIWILAEGKQSLLLPINLVGAVMNVILNMLMIPVWDATGAAIASCITQMFMNFVFGFIIKPLRHNNRLMLQSLSPKFLLSCFAKNTLK